MSRGSHRQVHSDLHRSYLLLGILVFVIGGAAVALVAERNRDLDRLRRVNAEFHLQSMVLCGKIEQHLLKMRVDLSSEVAWAGEPNDPSITNRRLAEEYVQRILNLNRKFAVAAVTPAARRLAKAQRKLDEHFRKRAGPELDPYGVQLLNRTVLRAEQLQRVHHAEHLRLQAKRETATQSWVMKLVGLAGLALLIGAIVVWRILDRADRAVVAWQEAEREGAHLYHALDAGLSEAYLVDPKTLRIAFASRGAATALGIPPDHLKAMRLTDIATELDKSTLRAVGSGERAALTIETVHERSDGERYPVQLSLQHIEQDGESRLLAVAMDVSDLREARVALEQAQKIEAAGQVAGGLAHDFNNLIMVIEGHAELLRMQRSTPALRAISEAAARAGALTKQLLQFSRKTIVQPVVLDLNEMLADVKYLLERLINANIKTIFKPAADSVVVKADRGQVQQVILNLCINAQDAMPEGGTLEISTGWARRAGNPGPGWTDEGEQENGDYAFLRIEDTGHGMDQATLKRAFDPFFTTKPVGRGTGLGLASVHSIATEHDGYVDVSSTVDEGSCFTVYLPKCDEDLSEYHRDRDDPSDARGTETILAVDDDDLVADLIVDVLQRKGYRVLVASTPKEAQDIVEREGAEIQLLITDLVMPEMTGYTLAELVTEQHPHIRVIYISGYAPEKVIPKRRLEADITFLQKPFPPRDLVRAARRVLDARR